MKIAFAHVNIIADDWIALASFYKNVFSCVEVPPIRKQSGDWLDKGTGLQGAQLEGVHLRLPGNFGNNGPTLEIYSYTVMEENLNPEPNRKGFGHIAFQVGDIESMSRRICKYGGTLLGKISQNHVEGVGLLTFFYCHDPEGNILEIQNWKKMNKVNIKQKFTLFNEYWTPKILGEINDFHVKIFKAKGEFVWHRHENDDEFFLVIQGKLTIKIRDQEDVVLEEGEFFIVPKGVEHCPLADGEAHVLLLEPKEVINTGEVQDSKTAKDLEWL